MISIRYAETDADVIAIHEFLCVVAGPTLPGPIDHKDSATEIWRVARESVAIMAISEERLVGTIGLIRPTFWWNAKLPFLANRWAFALPGSRAWKPMLREATAIAVASGLELHVISEARGSVTIFNKSNNRQVRAQPREEAPHVLR